MHTSWSVPSGPSKAHRRDSVIVDRSPSSTCRNESGSAGAYFHLKLIHREIRVRAYVPEWCRGATGRKIGLIWAVNPNINPAGRIVDQHVQMRFDRKIQRNFHRVSPSRGGERVSQINIERWGIPKQFESPPFRFVG